MFKQQKVGELSRSDKAEIARITDLYDKLFFVINDIKYGLEEILHKFENVDYDYVISFLESNPEDFIKRKFVEINDVDIKGISVEAIIKSDLLDLPKLKYETLISDHKKYLSLKDAIGKITNFNIDLRSCYQSEGDYTLFMITPKFEAELLEFYAKYTENDQENEQLQAVQNFIDAVNGLMKLGMVRKDQRWVTDIKFHPTAYNLEANSEKPLSLNSMFFFIRRRFGKGPGIAVH